MGLLMPFTWHQHNSMTMLFDNSVVPKCPHRSWKQSLLSSMLDIGQPIARALHNYVDCISGLLVPRVPEVFLPLQQCIEILGASLQPRSAQAILEQCLQGITQKVTWPSLPASCIHHSTPYCSLPCTSSLVWML